MSVRTYSAAEFLITIGVRTITAKPDATFIEVDRTEPTWTHTPDIDGGPGTRNKNSSKAGTFMLRLPASSPDNDYLAELAIADELTNAGLVPIAITDRNGTTVCAAASAWIDKPAKVARGKEIGDNLSEWPFTSGSIDIFPGSNAVQIAA